MKKIIAILILSTLALFIVTGCQNSKETAPESQTQTTGLVVDNQAISDADDATQALDTTQVDNDLGSAGESLNNW